MKYVDKPLKSKDNENKKIITNNQKVSKFIKS